MRFQLTRELNRVEYYGLGPHDNYSDRKASAWTGTHAGAVEDLYIPYSKPQDHGNREAVRWMELKSEKGFGLKVIAPEPLPTSVLPFTQEELSGKRHTKDLPKPQVSELRVAVQVSGVGNGSCGSLPFASHRTMSSEIQYRYLLVPFVNKREPGNTM